MEDTIQIDLTELKATVDLSRYDLWTLWTVDMSGLNIGLPNNSLPSLTIMAHDDVHFIVKSMARSDLVEKDKIFAYLEGFAMRDSLIYWER